MTEETALARAAALEEERPEIRRLMVFFAVVYFVEGLGQTGGLIAQPLTYFLKTIEGWTPLQVSAFSGIFIVPWALKAIYGAVSDFIPLFGYRRKAYLILANAGAAVAYFAVFWIIRPQELGAFLLVSTFGMAISSTLAGAVLVENGQRLQVSDGFVNQQWLWYNIAQMGVGFLGGELVQHLTPAGALHGAALIVAFFPLCTIFAAIFFVRETRSPIDVAELKRTLSGLVTAVKDRDLWIIAVFLCLYNFSPSFGAPLFWYETDTLKFTQAYIGILGTIGSAGLVVGALFYRRYMKGLSSRALVNLSIVLGVVATLAFLGFRGEVSAAIIGFFSGVAGAIYLVAVISLAADFCPQRVEGFAFAALLSIWDVSGWASQPVGSYLYEHAFHNRLNPLILVSAGATALIFLFVPMLRLGEKRAGSPAASVSEAGSLPEPGLVPGTRREE